jgi:uncharacterized protein YqfA (UPF0365 family)
MDKLKSKIDKGLDSYYLDIDIELIRESMKEEGADLEKESEKQLMFERQFKFRLKAQLNQTKDESLLEQVSEKFLEALNRNTEKPVAFLKALIEGNNFAVQYRNFDKLELDDIKKIIMDHNLLELLEELENESEK